MQIVIEKIKAGLTIYAIKEFRALYNVSLREAKDAVDLLKAAIAKPLLVADINFQEYMVAAETKNGADWKNYYSTMSNAIVAAKSLGEDGYVAITISGVIGRVKPKPPEPIKDEYIFVPVS